jgi:peptide/nickel transport system substrate-binding protein
MLANVAGLFDLPAVPRHLIADAYASDKQAALSDPYWARGFVGLGPYRLDQWTLGSQMQLVAFGDYFLGRPKIGRIVVDYFGDVNGVVTGLLSGDIDVAPVGALKAAQLVTLKNLWEANGAGTTAAGIAGARNYRFQHRDLAAPWAREPRVRQALIHMLDRPAIVDALVFGLTAPADTVVATADPV